SALPRRALRPAGTPFRTGGSSRHLHPGPNHSGLDAAARPGSGSDSQLDGPAEHDCLLRKRPVGGEAVVQDVVLPPPAKTNPSPRPSPLRKGRGGIVVCLQANRGSRGGQANPHVASIL